MMCKAARFLIVLLVCMNMGAQEGIAEGKYGKKAIIVYENEYVVGYKVNMINHLEELLHAFSEEVETISLKDYQSGDLDGADKVFVLNVENITNKNFLNDVTDYENNLYWIGEGIRELLLASDKYDVRYVKQNSNIHFLTYKGKGFLVNGNTLFPQVKGNAETKVLATMSDGYQDYPFVVQEKNLFYISRWDLGQSFIFEDSLYDFYEQIEFPESEIFVRIEDVHPFRDPASLKKIADYLYDQHVPFMIALIPTYVDQKTWVVNTLDQRPDFVKAIQYMQQKGGTVLMHGYTHQLGKKEVSGEGYEYWDMELDKPIDEDIQSYVRDRLLSGLRLCIEQGIYPLGFEAPHYAMNEAGYQVLKQYVSTYVGQFQNNNESFTTSTFPYVITNSENFTTFIPENLGFVESGKDFAVEEIKENYEKLSIVRGHTGGFFFHPYLDIQALKELIVFFKSQGVQFMDLKERDNQIAIDDVWIQSHEGVVNAGFDEDKAITTVETPRSVNRIIEKVNRVVVIGIVGLLFLFIGIFFVFRRMRTNKYIRRK